MSFSSVYSVPLISSVKLCCKLHVSVFVRSGRVCGRSTGVCCFRWSIFSVVLYATSVGSNAHDLLEHERELLGDYLFTPTLTLLSSYQNVLRLNVGLYRCLFSHYTFRLVGEVVLSS
jgi:hypothetical protein